MLISRPLISSLGGRGHEQPLICTRSTTFVEYINGARPIADFPERFGDVSIDHGGGTWSGPEIRQAQSLSGTAETPFSGSSVAVQYLVAGQSAVSQRKRPAVEAGGGGALVGPGESRDLFLCEAYRRFLVAAFGGLHCLCLVGSASAGCYHQGTHRDRDDALERMSPAATTGRAAHVQSLEQMAGGSAPQCGNLSEARCNGEAKNGTETDSMIDRVLTLEPFSYPWNRFSPRLVGG